MIENETLVHGQIDSSLQAWQPESFFINGLLLAVLATVLSYQSASLAYDLFLGNKPTGEVSAPDMHMLLLADEGSPLSVAAAIFRHDELDRARFYGDIPKSTNILRSRARIATSVIVKLGLMLLAAPLVNFVAVFLALENDENVSFTEASFGPIAYGFDRHKNLSLLFEPYAGKCFRFRTSFSHAADEHAQFFFCLDFAMVNLEERSETSKVIASALPSGQLEVILQPRGSLEGTRMNSRVEIFTADGVFRIAQMFTQDDLEDLTNEMAQYLSVENPGCPVLEEIDPSEERMLNVVRLEPAAASVSTVPNASRQNIPTASQTLECPPFETPGIFKVVGPAALGVTFERSNITLVDSDVFRVANVRDLPVDGSAPPWFDGRDLTLLKRRRNFVPAGILFIVAGVLLFLRILMECITNNDVYDGIDEVIARNIGLSNSYSLIRSDMLFRYDHKYQRGLTAHYGTARPGLPEVREFAGGAVGVDNAGSPWQNDIDPTRYYGEEIMNPTQMD